MTCFPFCFSKVEASSANNQPLGIDEDVSSIQNVRLFSYKELQTATHNFSPANKIGQGGFGSVYKGLLRDGNVVAVKVLSADSKQGVREFLTEINVISDIVHENLVELYGCCVEKNQRILVYGYLENNSLSQTLLGGSHSSIQFSWPARHKICIGVARGLAFLHEEVRPHIIHRDIKASNILLDKDLTPKISDFGLAKLIPAHLTHLSTRVAGTAGYLAPEYAVRGQVTRKSDIYSFGVLLLEIVSGRCNTNRRLPAGQQYLLEWAWDLYEQGKLVESVDSFLGGDFNAEEASRFLKVSLLCTQDMPNLRPSMSNVLKMLMGEIHVDNEKISKPGLLSDFMAYKDGIGKKTEGKVRASSTEAGSGKQTASSSSLGDVATSYGTMTFDSIFDRSN